MDLPSRDQPMQRLGVGSELPAVLAELGADPGAVFAAAGIDLREVQAAMQLEMSRLQFLLHHAAEVTGCAHLGLLLGQRFALHHQGVMGSLMQTAPTLRHALEDFVALQPGYSSGATVFLHRRGPDFAWGYGLYAGSGPGAEVLYDTVLAVGVRLVQILTGGAVGPVELHLSHAAPEHAAAFARLLRAPLRFNQTSTCLILDEAALRLPLPGANPVVRRQIQESLRALGAGMPGDWSRRVRHEVRRALVQAAPRMDGIAGALGVNLRTLRRRLADEGTTFAQLNDEVRLAVACELLDLTELPLVEVAAAVGLASPSVFSETFHRWTGQTPRVWRSAARAGEDQA